MKCSLRAVNTIPKLINQCEIYLCGHTLSLAGKRLKLKIHTRICPLMEFFPLLLSLTEKCKQKPENSMQELCPSFWSHLLDIKMHECCVGVCVCVCLCICVCVPETPRTLTAGVTPSSAVLCPFCQESRRERQSECVTVHLSYMCVKKGDTERKRNKVRERIFARLCGWRQSIVSSTLLLGWQT